MSTTTVSVRSTTRAARIEEVRRREAEARDAARRAAQRAAKVKADLRREAEAREAARRRSETANRAIAEQEGLFQQQVSRLDEAARRLPDLSIKAPMLETLRSGAASDPDKLEAYSVRLAAEVAQFSSQLDAAIAEGEHLLKRRLAKAAAWRTAADLEQQAVLRVQASREAALRLHTEVSFAPMPQKPGAEVELEAVEAYVVSLHNALDDIDRQYTSLIARDEARARAAGLAGSQVVTQNASGAHAKHETERQATAQAGLRASRDVALSSAGLRMDELSEAARFLIEDAVAQAHVSDRRDQVTLWIAREKQHRDGVQRALTLMQSAPDLVHDLPLLSQRWSSLLAQLQRVAGGLEAYTPSLDREYEQLCADACRTANAALTKADWLQAMSEQGFEVLEGEDGRGLVVVDLDHPEVWLEATELESEHGGFSAVLELKTDANSSPDHDATITSDICSKLTTVAGAATANVETQAEVIERENRITRGRRPAKARHAFAQNL